MKFFKILNLTFIILVSIYFFNCASTQQGERISKSKDQAESEKPNTAIQLLPDTLKKVEVKVQSEVNGLKDNKLPDTAQVTTKDTTKTPIELKESPNTAFAVQLGAYREIKNVEKFEKLVKKDFPEVTIRTEYDGETQNYKVTGGKFLTKDEAYKFRAYCIEKGYKDSWVIVVPK